MFTYKIDDELQLKLPEVEDAKTLFKLTNDSREYLSEWLGWLGSTKKVEDTKAFIEINRKNYAENKSLNTLILYRGEVVGTAGYNSIDWTNKIAKIGYWLGEQYQGKGIMTRVAKALTDYAFCELQLNRVDIRVAVENKKSRAIPERLSFQKEGTIRQAEWLYDHYVDHIIYGMLRSHWTTSPQ